MVKHAALDPDLAAIIDALADALVEKDIAALMKREREDDADRTVRPIFDGPAE